MMDIQSAIWYFADAGYPMPADPEAVAMINDALANGGGFRPKPGQIGAVILAVADIPKTRSGKTAESGRRCHR